VCSECASGMYGDQCGHRCRCANGAACDHVSGVCTCTAGWHGVDCDRPCPSGFYGVDCRRRCRCDGGHHHHHQGGTCDPVDGRCSRTPTVVSTALTSSYKIYQSSSYIPGNVTFALLWAKNERYRLFSVPSILFRSIATPINLFLLGEAV